MKDNIKLFQTILRLSTKFFFINLRGESVNFVLQLRSSRTGGNIKVYATHWCNSTQLPKLNYILEPNAEPIKIPQ